MLLTTRPIDLEIVFRRERNFIIEAYLIEIHPFDAASEIISFFCKEYSIEATSRIIDVIKDVSGENLWLLTYALSSLKRSNWINIEKESILEEVNNDLEWLAFKINDESSFEQNGFRSVQLLISLSVLYRYEILTDAQFIENAFPKSQNVLMYLASIGEIVEKAERKIRYYGLPHSSLAHLYFELRATWDDKSYQDEVEFLKSYLLSEHARNFTNVLSNEIIFDQIMPVLTFEDMYSLAHRIMASDLSGAAYAIKAIYIDDPLMGRRLLNSFDLSLLAKQIERKMILEIDELSESLYKGLARVGGSGWDSSEIISAIETVDHSKGQELISNLDLSKIAQHVVDAPDIWACDEVISYFPEIQLGLRKLLLDAIDVSQLAARFLNRDELPKATRMLKSLLEANPDKARALVEAVDWERITFVIMDVADMSDVAEIIENVREATFNNAHNLVKALDLHHLVRRVERTKEVLKDIHVFEAINTIDVEKGQEMWDIFDLNRISSILEDSESLEEVHEILKRIDKAKPARAKEIVACLNLARLAHRVEEGAWYEIKETFKAIWTIEPDKANALVGLLDLNRLARRVGEDFGWFNDMLMMLQEIHPGKATAFVALLDLNHLACEFDVIYDADCFIRTIQKIDVDKARVFISALESEHVVRSIVNCTPINFGLLRTIQAVDPPKAKKIAGILDLSHIARKIEIEKTLDFSAECIEVLNGIDPLKAQELIMELDLSCLVHAIEKGKGDFYDIFKTIDKVDHTKAQDVWNMMNLPRLVNNLLAHSNFLQLHRLIIEFLDFEVVKAQALVDSLDFPLLISRVNHADPKVPICLIKSIQDVNPDKGRKLTDQIDIKNLLNSLNLDEIAIDIMADIDFIGPLERTSDFLIALQAIDPEKAQELVNRLNSYLIADKIGKPASIYDSAKLFEALQNISSDKTQAILRKINLPLLAKRIERDVLAGIYLFHVFHKIDSNKTQVLLSMVETSRLTWGIRDLFFHSEKAAIKAIKLIKQVDDIKGDQVIQELSDIPNLQSMLSC